MFFSPAFANVGTRRFFANGVEVEIAHQAARLGIASTRRGLDPNPVGLALTGSGSKRSVHGVHIATGAALLNHASSAKARGMNHFSQLLAGYARFRSSGWKSQRERWDELREGQSPKVMVIACSDSRVEPSQIFDTTPGEIFVVRNVGALVPPFETSPGRHGVSAALEFAVQILKVEEIVVLGHGLCGGCYAALHRTMEGTEPGEGGFIADWISMLDDARDTVSAEHANINTREAARAMEFAAVQVSLDNLRSFPCVREKEKRGDLKLRGALFAISDGILHVLDEASGQFSPR